MKRSEEDEQAVLAALREQSRVNYAIVAASRVPFRRVDRALQRLKRRGAVVLLPRLSGVRPLPEWSLADKGRPITPLRDDVEGR